MEGNKKEFTTDNFRNRIGKETPVDGEASYSSEERQLKSPFTENNKSQAESYIKDLETTVKTSSEIIASLLENEKKSADQINIKLDTENKNLLRRLAAVTKKQLDTQTKLLISEQIAKDYMSKEEKTRKEFSEKKKEFILQLSKKELILQSYEKRNQILENLLKKHAEKDTELCEAMKELDTGEKQNTDSKCIENVVTEKSDPDEKVIESNNRIQELQAELANLTRENKRYLTIIKQLNENASHNQKLEEDVKKKDIEIASLNGTIEMLQKDIQKLKTDLKNLLEANEKLVAQKEAASRLEQKEPFNGVGAIRPPGVIQYHPLAIQQHYGFYNYQTTMNNSSELDHGKQDLSVDYKKTCGCKDSKCMCFASAKRCVDCNCTGCQNNSYYEERKAAITKVEAYNYLASSRIVGAGNNLIRCNCKKSRCAKNYCSCRKLGLRCGPQCGCYACENQV